MDLGTVVLDISSDEEDVGKIKSKLPSFDWVSTAPGTDDVVVVDHLSFDVKENDDGNASDDDCVVLDGDPDKPVALMQAKGGETDELLIVGEKGQLACRDYPHPRHLCATFPFSETPHERHCSQCHCYVCDSLAACAKWGDGSSPADHCHANGGDDWGRKREFERKANLAAPPALHTGATLLKHAHIPPIPLPSTTSSLINSGQLSNAEPIFIPPTISQPPTIGATDTFVTPNWMGMDRNLQGAALIQAKQKQMQFDVLNRTQCSVAPANQRLQHVRQHGVSSVQARPAFPQYKRARTMEACTTNVHANLSGQWQGVLAPFGCSPDLLAPTANRQLSVPPLPSSNGQIFLQVASQNPYVPVPYGSRRASTIPSARNNRTAAMQQRNQPARMHVEQLHSPANTDRFHEILAGLESELGLCPDVCAVGLDRSTNPFIPQSQICAEPSVHADAGIAPVTTCTNASIPTSSLLDGGATQDFAGCVENNSLQGWVSCIEQNEPSFATLKDPGALPPDPPDLKFDFEDLWR